MEKNKVIKISDLHISERAKRVLFKNGVDNTAQLCDRTKQDLLGLDGFGRTSLDELMLCFRSLKLKLKKKPKETQNTEFETYLIKRYIKPERLKSINWGHEINVARNLIKKYPKKEFWEWYALTFKLNSLLYFFGGGKEDLYKAYHSDKAKIPHINPSKPPPPKIQERKLVGENMVSKAKSIEDFLNGY